MAHDERVSDPSECRLLFPSMKKRGLCIGLQYIVTWHRPCSFEVVGAHRRPGRCLAVPLTKECYEIEAIEPNNIKIMEIDGLFLLKSPISWFSFQLPMSLQNLNCPSAILQKFDKRATLRRSHRFAFAAPAFHVASSTNHEPITKWYFAAR